QLAVEAESHPAGLIAEFDVGHLFRRNGRRVEDMQDLVEGIANPDFTFIGGQPDAVAGTTVSFDRPFREPRDLNTRQLLTGRQIAHFKAEQFVDVHETKSLTAVDRERANARAERADCASDLVRAR